MHKHQRAIRAEDVCAKQLVGDRAGGVDCQPVERGDVAEMGVAPQHRNRAGNGERVARELPDSCEHRFVDIDRREARRGERLGAGAERGPDQLGHEERVAVAGLGDGVAERVRRRVIERAPHELADRVARQRCEAQPVNFLVREQSGEKFASWTRFGWPGGHHERHGELVDAVDEVRHETQ